MRKAPHIIRISQEVYQVIDRAKRDGHLTSVDAALRSLLGLPFGPRDLAVGGVHYVSEAEAKEFVTRYARRAKKEYSVREELGSWAIERLS